MIAIGNFDGAHRGHAAVAEAARTMALKGRPAAMRQILALTFDPHPRAYFQPDRVFFRLSQRGHLAQDLGRIGFDGVVVLRFDAALSSLSARTFIEDILHARLGAAGIAVGSDFHFGKDRAGTPDFLVAEGKRLGFDVALVPPFRDFDGTVISSTAIRAALSSGDIPRANTMLGYEYAVEGPVLHGRKLGRELGYPTANMALDEGNGLRHGIYAVRVRVDGKSHAGVASFGTRPHFDNGAPLLETHLFDFAGDLYGKVIRVAFMAYLRGEEKFDNLDALVRQMDADSAEARNILATKP